MPKQAELFLVQAFCDQPDTRVDMGAELKESIAIWDREPNEKERDTLLLGFLADRGEEDNDNGWGISVSRVPFFRKTS